MQRNAFKGFSIFSKLLIAFLGLAISISTILTLAYHKFSKISIKQNTQESVQQKFKSVNLLFEHAFKENLVSNLNLLVSNPLLDDFIMSTDTEKAISSREIEKLFQQVIHYKKLSTYKSIYFVDYFGKEKIGSNRTERIKELRDISKSELFTAIESGLPGGINLFGPVKDKNGDYIFSAGIHKIDPDIGEFGGAIIINFGLEQFFSSLNEIKFFGQNPIWIFSKDGRVMKRPEDKKAVFDPTEYLPKEFQKNPGLLMLDEGILIYQDFFVIPDKPFIRIAISIPSFLLLEAPNRALRFSLIVFIASLLLALIAAFLLSKHLSDPITKLAKASSLLAKGELSMQVKVNTSGELGMLVDSFNKMAADLNNTTISRNYMDSIVNTMTSAMIVVNHNGIIEKVNTAVTSMLGYNEKEIIDKSIEIIISGEKDLYKERIEKFITTIQKDPVKNLEIFFLSKNGAKIPVLFSSTPMYDINNKSDRIVCIAQDIIEIKKAEKEILHMAYYDGLTNLPNRIFFEEQLQLTISNNKRYNRISALLFLDLDNFKQVNDTYGHNIGDLLLREVANRLKESLRKSDFIASNNIDSIKPIAARLGGDEFILLLSEVNHIHEIAKVTERFIKIISEKIIIKDHEIFITPSVGICVYPTDGDNVDDIMKNADTAMYYAKSTGKNNYKFYKKFMNVNVLERLELENDLHRAIERKEFLLYYQPQIDISTGSIVCMEALLRWQHPNKGILPPSVFLNTLEETGLIIPVSEWVQETACKQNKAWQKKGFNPICMSVNLTGLQFKQQGFIDSVRLALDNSGMDPKYLILEITENIVMTNIEETIKTLSTLKAMGIKLSMDDFGTGYSSFANLRHFSLNEIKIDRSFIKDIPLNADTFSMVKAIIAMADSLSLSVVAEGVELREQLFLLYENGCNIIQGYIFSKPLPEKDITEILIKEKENKGIGLELHHYITALLNKKNEDNN